MEKFYEDTRVFTKSSIVMTVLCLWATVLLAIWVHNSESDITTRILDDINAQTTSVYVEMDQVTGDIVVTEIPEVYDMISATRSPIAEFNGVGVTEKETAETESVEVVTMEAEVVEPIPEDIMSDEVNNVPLANSPSVEENITNIVEPINTWFGEYTDIGSNNGVTAEMLDACTAYYSQYQQFENQFLGKGWVFIEAGEQSGLDPLWIYSVAVFESGWGTSDLALNRSNYFGIGAWDTDINRAKVMGDDFYNGIVNGACWIADNYYNEGLTCMYLMNSIPNYSYAPGNTIWIPTICDFINDFYANWRV